jgi:predicted P-loop ATPase
MVAKESNKKFSLKGYLRESPDPSEHNNSIEPNDDNGVIKPSGQQNNALGKLESFLSDYYDFRLNPVVDRTEFRAKGETDYKLLTERDLNTIFRKVKSADFEKCTLSLLKSILYSDFVPVEDPFQAYFKSLPDWDSKTDYVAQLATVVKTTNDVFWTECFQKWLVAVVACALDEQQVNQQVLVLSGDQGIGKSTFLNSLLPPALKGYLFSGIVHPNNKDTLVNLSENLLINLDELENLNKTELGSLKSLVTQSAVRLRKAYGQFNENLARRASFMGSVNDVEFLTDSTGNRRYLCFTATTINLDHGVDMNMVYSQAYSLYKNGLNGKPFRWWFSGEDIKQINLNNADYVRTSSEEELLLKYFKLPQGEGKLMTPVEIVAYVEQKEGIRMLDNSSLKRMGQALTKHEFKKKSKGNSKPYMVSFRPKAESTKDKIQKEHALKEAERRRRKEAMRP